MQIIHETTAMQHYAEARRRAGRSIGLVPTMGALPEGHLSLIRRSRADNDVAVMTLFVNPMQFDRKDDLARYPRDLDRDADLAKAAGAEVIFHPSAEEMYPKGYATYVTVEGLTDRWEGATRPGHFRGVATVCTKLFAVSRPHRAYFGQKDYQQSLVIRRLVADLNLGLEIVVLPTVREADGLALSSRNVLLGPEERRLYDETRLAAVAHLGALDAPAAEKRIHVLAALTRLRQLACHPAPRGPDLESDLRGRDFTINAMAVSVEEPFRLLDPLGGAQDLRAGRLRACSASTFLDDPVRILRCVRQAVEFNFANSP